jgi:hypothetical protein
MQWGPKQIDDLRDLWEKGFTFKEIAAHFTVGTTQCTRNMVAGKIGRLGLMRLRGHNGAQQARRQNGKREPCADRELPSVAVILPLPPIAPPPAPRIKPDAGLPEAVPVTLLERRADQCCYPVNDGGPYLFCGAPKKKGSSYCEKHHKSMYRPAKFKLFKPASNRWDTANEVG